MKEKRNKYKEKYEAQIAGGGVACSDEIWALRNGQLDKLLMNGLQCFTFSFLKRISILLCDFILLVLAVDWLKIQIRPLTYRSKDLKSAYTIVACLTILIAIFIIGCPVSFSNRSIFYKIV
uniref:Uncharacterized protein n=1 Tax=Romanomermis culicivorax TaxID=13658 RepID=A0A915JYF9_ROMCU